MIVLLIERDILSSNSQRHFIGTLSSLKHTNHEKI